MRKYYFINKFDTNIIDKQKIDTGIIYRNYNSQNDLNTIIKLKQYCKKKGYKFFLSNNARLAINLNLDGMYIPSFNKNINHLSFSRKKKFLIIGSAHNNYEILVKKKQGCNIIFLSPIFKINKTNIYLDTVRFNLLTINKKAKFIALGGINSKNIKKLRLLNIFGFAGITFFQKKTAPNRGR